MIQKLINRRNELILEKIKSNRLYNLGIEVSEEDINKLLKFGELNPLVLDFINRFNSKFKDYNYLLMKNLEDLHIYINHNYEDITTGHFENNKLYIFLSYEEDYDPLDEVFIDTLYHELLHAATYDKKNDTTNTGFRAKVGGHSEIGYRLNEGYTELLANNLTNHSGDNYYEEEKRYAENVERLIGKEKMQDAYFHGDLYKVIEGLEPYIDNPLRFIMDSDYGIIDPNEILDKIDKNQSKQLIKR